MLIAQKYNLKRLASDIYASGVNLAERFPEWITLMYSMAGGGKDLLDSFLRLASLGSTYKQKENRRAFLHAVNVVKDDSLAGFLKIAQSLGYKLDDYLTPEGWEDRKEWIRQHGRGAPGHMPKIHPSSSPANSSPKMNLISSDFVQKCRSNSSAFVQSLVTSGILTPEQATAAADLYRLGAMRDGSVIFWQIDAQGQVREGKIMLYGPDCHRIKTSGAQWMGWMLRYKLKDADGKPFLEGTWHATQCLFGEHLIVNNEQLIVNNGVLREKEGKVISIVEAEKTAVILSQLMPDKLWLAAGGESQLNLDKLVALRGHKIILYPDTDPEGATFSTWKKIADEARRQLSLNISISDLLEKHATSEQKERKIDLVDFLIESNECGVSSEELSPSEVNKTPQEKTFSPEVTSMIEDNPAMQDLINAFDLVEVTNN